MTNHDAGAPRFTGESVLITFAHRQACRRPVVERLRARDRAADARALAGVRVRDGHVHYLREIDLAEVLTDTQTDALRALRAEFGGAGRVHVATSTNYRCYEHGTPQDSDTSMGFLTRWRPDKSLEEQDEYWRKANWNLIADERKFTLSPEWLVFERVSVIDG